MPPYLHQHPEFSNLIQILSEEKGIPPVLVEKDYWIMQGLYGLQQLEFRFQLKGGTSLSKGFQLIHRFSEDIDILIEPPESKTVYVGKNHLKPYHCNSRKAYYDWLSKNISIEGIQRVARDTAFDDEKYRSGGIRLYYQTLFSLPEDLKEGVLLEVGFDTVSPYELKTISSWAFEKAKSKVDIKDNRAQNIPCYHPGYTLVEKLQTVSTKFRKQQRAEDFSENFMRHYYDIYCLLGDLSIQVFCSTKEYLDHKKKRFRKEDEPNISKNKAFLLEDLTVREKYADQYHKSQSLYYQDKPEFEEILNRIRFFSNIL